MTNAIIEIIAYCIVVPLLAIGIILLYNYIRFCRIKPGYRLHTEPVWDVFNEYTYMSTIEVYQVRKKGPFVKAIELEDGKILNFWKVYGDIEYSL